MTSHLTLHSPYRRADGQIGAHARLVIQHDSGWHHTYGFDTHGMSVDEVTRKVAGIEAYHDVKAALLDGFRAVQGQVVDGYTIVDCTIMDAEVTLYLDVRDGAGGRVPGFPLRIKCLSIERIPSNSAILDIVQRALPQPGEDIQAAHKAFVARLSERMGG